MLLIIFMPIMTLSSSSEPPGDFGSLVLHELSELPAHHPVKRLANLSISEMRALCLPWSPDDLAMRKDLISTNKLKCN